MAEFYGVVSTVCFLMLGFWWSVTSARREEWMADPAKRRMAYDMTLQFLVPGLVSQLAILGIDSPMVWRVGFVVAALIGIVETATLMSTAAPGRETARWFAPARWSVAGIYALMGVVGIDPKLPSRLGLEATGLQTEGVLIGLMIFIGANFAWFMMAQPIRSADVSST